MRPFEAGKVLELAHGQVMEKLDVSLPRAGVVTGRVFDEFGEPMTGARISAMRYRYLGGQRRLMNMGPGDTTDDIGQYRLHGLSPGEYYVSAQTSFGTMFGQSDDRVGYATTYYPGTAATTEAQRVNVAVGQETAQVNFAMSSSRIATVSGTAVSSSGRPIDRGFLSLVSNVGGMPMMSMGTQLKPDGTFQFSNITPGEYRVQVQHVPNADGVAMITSNAPSAEFGSVTITVSGQDVTGLSIVTSTGATASGRVVFESASKPPVTPNSLNIFAATIEKWPRCWQVAPRALRTIGHSRRQGCSSAAAFASPPRRAGSVSEIGDARRHGHHRQRPGFQGSPADGGHRNRPHPTGRRNFRQRTGRRNATGDRLRHRRVRRRHHENGDFSPASFAPLVRTRMGGSP